MESPASIADRTMIGRSARPLISRARVRPSIRGIIMSMIRRSGQPDFEPPERLVAVARGLDLEPVRAELVGEEDEEVRVVVDDQDPRRRRLAAGTTAQHRRLTMARA